MTKGIKEQLADAMVDIAHEKDLGKITVKDLVNACGVSRQTFYYYYSDIFDVIAYVLESSMSRYVEESLAIQEPLESAMHLVNSVIDNSALIRHGLASKLRPDIERMLIEKFRRYVRVIIEQKIPNAAMRPAEMETLCDFIACGLMGEVVENSINPHMDVEEFCRQIMALVHARLDQMS